MPTEPECNMIRVYTTKAVRPPLRYPNRTDSRIYMDDVTSADETVDLCPQLLCERNSEAHLLYLRAVSCGFLEPLTQSTQEDAHDD